MNQAGGRVASKIEREQIEQLDALRQVGVDIGGDAYETMSALVLEHFAQVIGHAVGAVLRRESVEKSYVSEDREAHSEDPAPQLRDRRERLSGRTGKRRNIPA